VLRGEVLYIPVYLVWKEELKNIRGMCVIILYI
jgi:hypothetical protein